MLTSDCSLAWSAGGIAALECAARHDVFASATAFSGFLESAETEPPQHWQLARLAATLRRKPLRIYVGDQDELFHSLATEQFGVAGGTVVSGRPEIVRVIVGAGHELFPDLNLGACCDLYYAHTHGAYCSSTCGL